MTYQVADILKDVRVALDQDMASAQLLTLADADTLSLDDIIVSKICEGVRQVHMEAPVDMLELGHNIGDGDEGGPAIHWGELQSGWIDLPDDFMRLMVFEMSDWERPVYNAIVATDPAYGRLRSRIKALRGTPQKPVCAIGIRPAGRVLEFYSCKNTDATVVRAVYMPEPEIKDDGICISRRCYRSAINNIAGLVLVTLGDREKAESFFQQSIKSHNHEQYRFT